MNAKRAVFSWVATVAVVCSVGWADSVPNPQKSIQIEKMVIGTAIDNHELTGAAQEFNASVSRLYCWTKVNAQEVPTSITHVWYADDKKEAEVPLNIKSSSMRTWSSKSVWPGQWKVEAVDGAGNVLSSVEFTVK